MAKTHLSGPLVETSSENSQVTSRGVVRNLSSYFIPYGHGTATTHFGPFRATAGTWTQSFQTGPVSRLRRTAAATDDNPSYELLVTAGMLGVPAAAADAADSTLGEQTRGPRITSLDLVYQLTTGGPLDAHVATLGTFTWANAAAIPTEVNRPVTGTLAVAVAATPYVTRLTVTTPFVLTPLMQMALHVRIDGDAGAAVLYDFWGLGVNFDWLL